MDDVHNIRDERRIPIDQVGIRDLQYPIVVRDRTRAPQHTVARLSMAVNLPHDRKGVHMSRFIEVLHEHHDEMTLQTIPVILQTLKARLAADSAWIEAAFPYFVSRAAPVTGARALLVYQGSLSGEINGQHDDFAVSVAVPVTSLCPCSKSISDYGAHNQRGHVTIKARCARSADGRPMAIDLEDLIDMAESSASSPVYPLLKRSDERHVTMHAYDHPVFVEDIVREIVLQLQHDARVGWFRVQVVNHESIHDHSVFATLERTRSSGRLEVPA